MLGALLGAVSGGINSAVSYGQNIGLQHDQQRFAWKQQMEQEQYNSAGAQVDRLKQAGLNPILAAPNAGDSSGGNGTGISSSGQGPDLAQGANSGASLMNALQTNENLRSQQKNTDADTANKTADTANKNTQNANIIADTANKMAEHGLINANTAKSYSETALNKANEGLSKSNKTLADTKAEEQGIANAHNRGAGTSKDDTGIAGTAIRGLGRASRANDIQNAIDAVPKTNFNSAKTYERRQ